MLMNRILHSTSIALLLFGNTSNKPQPLSPYINGHIAVCTNNADSLPLVCIPADNLREQAGGIVNIEIPTPCGVALTCTWACITKKNNGPFFAVKHGTVEFVPIVL